MIKNFAFFESNTYIFNNEIVSVVDKFKLASGEFNVVYLDQYGKQQNYLADTEAEFYDDFVPTNSVYVKKTDPLKKTQEDERCNLVYYVGDKKIETVKRNIPKKLAYALKNSTYKNNSTYRNGKFEVEPIIEKVEGMIPHYTDPNKGNQGYNWSAIPKKNIKKSEGPNMLKIAEIGIGTSDPVKQFKEWNGKYWLRKKKKIKENAEQIQQQNVDHEIGIGESDAVLKFKNWSNQIFSNGKI